MKLLKIKSIRTKLLVVTSLIFFLMLTLIMIINVFLMDDFFIVFNKINMTRSVNQYANAIHDQSRDKNIAPLEQITGGVVFIYDANGEVTSINNVSELEILSDEELEMVKTEIKLNKEEGFFSVLSEDGFGRRLVYSKLLNDDSFVVIIKPLGIVNEVRSTFTFFLSIIMIITYIIAFFVIYFIAGRMTRPIIALKDTAKRIAVLDFSHNIDINADDEIGELVVSVNTMALELEKNIEALNESNGRLAKELAREKSLENMRRRFVSDVSHELKNPLSIISAYADGLEKGVPKTKEDTGYYLQVIVEEVTKMNQLITDLLDLSSYETGTFTLKKEALELNELVENAIERYEYIMDEKSIEVVKELEGVCTVYGDRLRLGQVMMNLVNNAFKYVNENGKIIVQLRTDNNKITLIISNTGPLIPETELDNIWNSFYQVDTIKDGNGLGLAIVKSIVNLHDGEVRAYIKAGMNCFEVRF